MPKKDRHRALYVLKYLWEHTDEEHPVTLAQIQIHLFEQSIAAIPKKIEGDITALQDLGFDIIRNRSTQNQYFFASRHFSSFELKMMIDAVQAAHFIPREVCRCQREVVTAFSTQKILLLDIEKTRYCYLAVLYLFSFFGDIFLRLHLRDLCYTGHNERLKNRDDFLLK